MDGLRNSEVTLNNEHILTRSNNKILERYDKQALDHEKIP